jgi:predicted DNA-binding ribbon-helix-helix protein
MGTIVKRSVVLAGHKTSVSLEEAFWSAFKEIAAREKVSPSQLVSRIDAARGQANLSSAIRMFVLDHYRQRTTDQPPPSLDRHAGNSRDRTSAN